MEQAQELLLAVVISFRCLPCIPISSHLLLLPCFLRTPRFLQAPPRSRGGAPLYRSEDSCSCCRGFKVSCEFFSSFFSLPKRIESSSLFLLSSYVSLRFGLTMFSCFLRVQEMALFFPRVVVASDGIAWLFAVVLVCPIDSWKFYALPPL